MDPASLTLAIVPLVVTAIKGYKAVRSKFRTFCHYSTQVERTRKLFGVQRDYFFNEIELMLKLALGDTILVRQLLKDPSSMKWEARGLKENLEQQLGRNQESFKNTVEDIGELMTALEEGFQCFAPLRCEHEKDENLRKKPFKDAIKKLRTRVTITFKKETFESQITSLEKSNDNLRRLREQLKDLRQPPQQNTSQTPFKPCCHEKKAQLSAEFGAFSITRRASRALHEALESTWCSTPAAQQDLRHSVRLFLDAKADEEVQMDIAIGCHNSHLDFSEPGLVQLQVRSKTLDSIEWVDSGLLSPQSQSQDADTPRKRRKVRFAACKDDLGDGSPDSTESQETLVSETSTVTGPEPEPKDISLPLSGHFCPEILGKACEDKGRKACFGHIDNATFRHWLYPPSSSAPSSRRRLGGLTATPISQVLAEPVHKAVSVIIQLRLALSLASAVLKFSSTPWLNDLWTVKDLAFLRARAENRNFQDIDTSTLHFNSEFAFHLGNLNCGSGMDVETGPTPQAEELQEAQYRYGVRNVVLYSLGVALLAIGRWEDVDPGDVESVRRLAAGQGCYLGPKYQMLTERVLECDFGYGKDLRKPRLQEAVYEGVVVELEGMIAGLEIQG